MTDTVLRLGEVEFQGFEVPEEIPFGGEQMLAEHRLVGGRLVVDGMGRADAPIDWAGRFRGPDATSRARAVDAMRIAGLPVELSWDEYRYTVVIRRFEGQFQRFYEIPYRISCVVIEDLATPLSGGSDLTVDDMLADDMSSASVLGGRVGDASLTGLLGGLSSAMGSVSSFASASQATLNTVLNPLAAVQGRVEELIASADAVIGAGPLSGVLSAGAASDVATDLLARIDGFGARADLHDLESLTARMATNLANVTASGAQIVQAGGDLYTLAADAYGDATAWAGIARANGLTDPVLQGLNTILVPRTPSA